MRSLNEFAQRSLTANRTRTLLSILAVSFGAATTIAGNVVAESSRRAIITSEDLNTIAGGLVSQLDTMMAFVSVVIMAAAAFLIFNAFAMSITQRRQQIGSLRALGMTRQQTMRLILTEAAFVALVGTVLGLIAGPILGRITIAAMRAFGGGLFAFSEAEPSVMAVLLALFLGLGFTVAAAYFPARSAASIAPLDALRTPEAEFITGSPLRRARIGAGIIFLLLGYLIVAPPGKWVTFPVDANLSALLVGLWLLALVLILPAVIGVVGRLIGRSSSGIGRLAADNLQRGRRRVMLTILTLAFALAMITGLTGFINFMLKDLIMATMAPAVEKDGIYVSRIDGSGGWEAIIGKNLDSVLLTNAEAEAVQRVAEGRASYSPNYFVVAAELSFLGDAFFSNMLSPDALQGLGETAFKFTQGDWESAIPIMKSGCGVLISPLVAKRNQAENIGDTFSVTTPNGPLTCTVAGIGVSAANASIVSLAAADHFNVTQPVMILMTPHLGTDTAAFEADLRALIDDFPAISVVPIRVMVQAQEEVVGTMIWIFNGLLLLAILAAALGVVNTMLMSVTERKREIGLIRATGATQGQTRRLILGEAALMGLIGGSMGLVAGLGAVMIFVVTYGGNSFGLELDLWPAAFRAVQSALLTGAVGLVASPLMAAAAAWLPARTLLRKNPVEALAL